eukprot:m.63396 g.63396  ORF g.63396 m.63396 type:complete len:62 (-) comp11435_c0_seq1:678-863(-)
MLGIIRLWMCLCTNVFVVDVFVVEFNVAVILIVQFQISNKNNKNKGIESGGFIAVLQQVEC